MSPSPSRLSALGGLLLLACACTGGAPGAAGPTGPQGPPGPPGPPGPTGPIGATASGGLQITVADGGLVSLDGGTLRVDPPVGATGATGPTGFGGADGGNGVLLNPVGTAVTFNGAVTLAGGLRLTNKVVKTAGMTGDAFLAELTAMNNVCPAGYNPCTGWQAMALENLSTTPVFDSFGWIAPGFTSPQHIRTLFNGQDSSMCGPTEMMIKYPSTFTHVGITTPGGLHCQNSTNFVFPVWCCRR